MNDFTGRSGQTSLRRRALCGILLPMKTPRAHPEPTPSLREILARKGAESSSERDRRSAWERHALSEAETAVCIPGLEVTFIDSEFIELQ